MGEIAFLGLRELVKNLLKNPFGREWSLQGFGMFRTYLTKELRLHVWDSRYRVKDVTDIHTHPWNFTSLVISGEVENRTYWPNKPYFQAGSSSLVYNEGRIICGPQPKKHGAEIIGRLEMSPMVKTYRTGDVYQQQAEDKHSSHPSPGAVTLIHRALPAGADPDTALVYWPVGTEWVSAEPREATRGEVSNACAMALECWR